VANSATIIDERKVKMKKRPKTKRNISLDADLYDKLKAMAEEENRSLSNLIEVLILKALREEK